MMLSSRDANDTVHPAIPHLQPRRDALSSCNGLPCASVCTDIAPGLTALCSCGVLGNTKCRQLRFHCDRGDPGEEPSTSSGSSGGSCAWAGGVLALVQHAAAQLMRHAQTRA